MKRNKKLLEGSKKILKRSKKNAEGKVKTQGHPKFETINSFGIMISECKEVIRQRNML